MGNFKEEKGDLIRLSKQRRFDMICRGANCFSIMGAGIAAQIKKHYPETAEIDRMDCRKPIQKFGGLSYRYEPSDDVFVVNMYTQYHPGANFDELAFRMCIKKFQMHFEVGSSVGFPMIGCGIGGGDWDVVKEIIKEELWDYFVTIVHYEP